MSEKQNNELNERSTEELNAILDQAVFDAGKFAFAKYQAERNMELALDAASNLYELVFERLQKERQENEAKPEDNPEAKE